MAQKPKYKSLKPNGKNATGRPDKWSYDELINELKEMNNLLDKPIKTDSTGKPVQYFFFKELCLERGYSSEFFYHKTTELRAEDNNTKFNQLYKMILNKLETKLLRMSLGRQFNTAGVIFALKNLHGYRDNLDIDHTSKGESITSFRVEIVDGKSN